MTTFRKCSIVPEALMTMMVVDDDDELSRSSRTDKFPAVLGASVLGTCSSV